MSMSPETLPGAGNTDATFGVLFVGFMFSSAFYGCTFFQSYVFYTRYPSEHVYTKGIVGLLCTADTVVTGLLFNTMYEYLVNNFLVSFDRLNVLRAFVTALALTNLEILLVQLFYAFRIWTLANRRPILPALMSFISIASFALTIATAVQMSKQSLFIDIVTPKVELLAGLSEGLATLCNILIVATQYFYLNPRRQPGMKIQQNWFDVGVLHILSRGILFMIMQIILLLAFVTIPHQYVWTCFHFVIGKVYTNSLLAMLNSRHPYHGRGLNEEESLNTRGRSIGVNASRSIAGPGGGSVGGDGQRKSTLFTSPVSPLNIDAKGGRSVAMELDVVPSSDFGAVDGTAKSDPFDSTPDLYVSI